MHEYIEFKCYSICGNTKQWVERTRETYSSDTSAEVSDWIVLEVLFRNSVGEENLLNLVVESDLLAELTVRVLMIQNQNQTIQIL